MVEYTSGGRVVAGSSPVIPTETIVKNRKPANYESLAFFTPHSAPQRVRGLSPKA